MREADTFETQRLAMTDEMRAIRQQMESGACKSYDEYKYLCGKLFGLKLASNIVNDTEKKYLEE